MDGAETQHSVNRHMTRHEFEKHAIRIAERNLGVPPGWWGNYADVHGPAGERVYKVRGSSGWAVSLRSKVISRHDSRSYAIAKARKTT